MSYDTLLYTTYILIIACGALIGILTYIARKNQYITVPPVTVLKTLLGADVIGAAFISWYLLKNFSVRSDIYFNFQFVLIIAIAIMIIGEYFSYNIGMDESRFKISLVFSLISLIVFIVIEFIKNLNNLIDNPIWIIAIGAGLIILLQLTLNRSAYIPDSGSQKLYTANTAAVSILIAESVTEVIKDKSYNTLMFMIGAALLFLTYVFMRLWGGASDRENFAGARTITLYAGLMLIALSISPEYLDFFAY